MLDTNSRRLGYGASILLLSALLAVSAPGLATHISDTQDDLDDECNYLNTRPFSEAVEEETGFLSLPFYEFKDDDACDENTEDARSRFEASLGDVFLCVGPDLGGLDESPVGPVQPDFSTGATRCVVGGFSLGDADSFGTFEGDGDTTDDPDDVVQNVTVDVDADSGNDIPISWAAYYEPDNNNTARDTRGDTVVTCATTDPGSDDVDFDVKAEYGLDASADVTQVVVFMGPGLVDTSFTSVDDPIFGIPIPVPGASLAENPCSGDTLDPNSPTASGTIYYDWEH